METRQLVHVDIRVSQSERCQQLSWAYRTTCPGSKVSAYPDMGGQMEHPRQKDILSSQLTGFIAGLAQFEGWSSRIKSLPRLIALLAQEDESIKGIVHQTVQRLELQGLLRTEGPAMGRAISLQGGIPNTFLALLPLVNYDTRLAYLLMQPSNPMPTRFKIQAAAMLTISQDKLINFAGGIDLIDWDFIQIAMRTGYGANLASFGSLWMVLGLLKKGKANMIYKDDSRPFVDEKVTLDHGACQEWETRCREILHVLSPGQSDIEPLDELGTLTDSQVEALHWDCLQAFASLESTLGYPYPSLEPSVCLPGTAGCQKIPAFLEDPLMRLCPIQENNRSLPS